MKSKSLTCSIILQIFAFFLLSSSLCAETLFDWNAQSAGGHNWPGWTWKDNAAYGHPGWWKDDGHSLSGNWFPRSHEKSDYGNDTSAIIDTSDRAPSTSAGSCIKFFDTGQSGTYQACWWLFIKESPLGTDGITNGDTDRWSFYLKIDGMAPMDDSGSKDSIPNANFHIGTYLCWGSGSHQGEGCPYEGPGNQHYYHYLSVNPGTWIHVELDQHPAHRRGVSGNVANDPSYVESGEHYFEHLLSSYFEIRQPQGQQTNFKLDEMYFYSTKESFEPNQNDESITSLWVGYWPGKDYWEIGWNDCSFPTNNNNTNSVFEVRWSTSPITNENFENANPITPLYYKVEEHLVRKSNPWQNVVWTRFRLPDNIEQTYNHIYFAIKDISRAGQHVGPWPYNNGDGHDAPNGYIHTIDYYLRPNTGGGDAVPSANAGSDQTITDNDNNGFEMITFDGSGSSDPDGTIVSYVWKENGSQIAQGETANVELAVGIHVITLEVTDNDGATNTDVVRITVQSSNGNRLAISNVTTLCPSDQNVTIKWVTDQPASGKVEYGTDTSYGQESSTDSSLSINHCIILTGLSANTTYHFRVISQDGSGNTGTSDDYTFTTLPDHSNGYTCIWIEAENGVINSPMQIETDSLASNGKYITTPQGTGNTTNPSAEAIYDVDIKQAGDYYIWLLMYGPSGNNDALYIGPNGSFDRVYPSQSGQYEWVQVEVEHKSGNYAHHLNAGINRIAIGHGEELARADKILITDSPSHPSSLGDTTSPGDITNFSATTGDRQVTLSWTNPSDSDFAGVIIRYRTDTWPTDYNDGQLLCNRTGTPGSSDSFMHTGLQNETTYYYSAFTYDSSGNYSQAAHVSATPGSTGNTNQAPTASISASPTSGKSPLTVNFSGTGSDSDGTIQSYSWNFGDSTTSTSQNPTHTYARVSSQTQYTVSLTVIDDDGATAQTTTTITVLPDSTPPTAPRNFSVE